MKILVVEPHPDDAFLSLGWHIRKLWAEEDVTILTVYADARRTKEATAYAESVGAKSLCLGLAETKMLASGTKTRMVPELATALKGIPYDRVIFPLGLQHPDHLSVAATRPAGAWRYLDTPYQTKQKLGESLNQKMDGMLIRFICFPPKRKWDSIPIFKSQAKFFHFNADIIHARVPEIIVGHQ